MPSRKKKFIDKKHAVTFRLVHRSQKDPLQASEDVGQRVLLPVNDGKDIAKKRKEEQRKFGVFYDDDYDYLQHLKDTNETYELEPIDTFRISRPSSEQAEENVQDEPNLKLPSSVFASSVETGVGLLNKAAPVRGPRLDWDPDIVAALDEDFNYDDLDNELEDDFVVKAMEAGSEDGDDEWEDGDVASDEADGSDDAMDDDYGEDMFKDEETKTRFTNYSTTSSVIRRNEGLALLDNRFEKMFEQYDDVEIGALDHEDIEGGLNPNSTILDDILEQFEKDQTKVKLKDVVDDCVGMDDVALASDEESDTSQDLVKMVVEEPKQKWDCESILSTYSTLYNHPQTIPEPKKEKKIDFTSRLGIPADTLSKPGLTRKQIEKEMHISHKADRSSTYRPKGEKCEERKSRKQAIKEERKERRVEKKVNKMAFSSEKKRQAKELLNLHNNLQGIKIV